MFDKPYLVIGLLLALAAATTALASVHKKGTLYGRVALQCGAKKKTFVFSPIVTFHFSLITTALKKSSPAVSKEWKSKTTTSFLP